MKATNYTILFRMKDHYVAGISRFFFLFAVSFILFSCQEPLDVEYKHTGETILNVEAKITTDTTAHYVFLSSTIPLDEDNLIWETGATVTITNNNQIMLLEEKSSGHYFTDSTIFGVIGHRYDLRVELANGDVYTASTEIENVPDIDSLVFSYEEFENYGMYFHNLYFFGWELEEAGNAYLWNLYINDTLYNDTLWKTVFVDDEFVNGNYIGLSADTSVKGSFPIYTLQPHELTTDTVHVKVEMESLPHNYYVFWNTLMQQTEWTGSPFDANKADPISNISNGAMGFFYGASIKRYTFDYIRPEESKNVDQPIF